MTAIELETVVTAISQRQQELRRRGVVNGEYLQDRQIRNLMQTYQYLQLGYEKTNTDYSEFVDLLATVQGDAQ